jgi:cytochrome c oxidase assembly protein subunit 11
VTAVPPNTPDDLARKNRRAAVFVFGIVAAMLCLTAASVKLYRLYCEMTGFGGQATQAASVTGPVLNQTMTVRFNTDVSEALPWAFQADQPPVRVHIGQEAIISFTATNQGGKAIAGTALYNIDPPVAGKYFHKTQCFCFDYQLIAPKQSAHFPVVFYIDPDIVKDPELRGVQTITLSYSFFKAESPELDRALEDFYNGKKSGTTSIKIN